MLYSKVFDGKRWTDRKKKRLSLVSLFVSNRKFCGHSWVTGHLCDEISYRKCKRLHTKGMLGVFGRERERDDPLKVYKLVRKDG